MVVGDQVPEIPLGEVVFKTGTTEPLQKLIYAIKSGVILGITTKVIEIVLAHWPGLGKNVYNFVIELSKTGDQVPIIPLLEVVVNGDKLSPEQIGLNALKVGVTVGGVMVTVNAIDVAHCPGFGVKI